MLVMIGSDIAHENNTRRNERRKKQTLKSKNAQPLKTAFSLPSTYRSQPVNISINLSRCIISNSTQGFCLVQVTSSSNDINQSNQPRTSRNNFKVPQALAPKQSLPSNTFKQQPSSITFKQQPPRNNLPATASSNSVKQQRQATASSNSFTQQVQEIYPVKKRVI